jgi:glyoxylase-like metal-dependent hydrolase (beta-lactamase superfamily II)
MFLEIFPTGPFQANCILLGDPVASTLVVIDPGDEAERIHERVKASGLAPEKILHTHGHVDHVGGTAELRGLLGANVSVALHRDELPVYRSVPEHGRLFGFEIAPPPDPDLWMEHGDRISVGSLELEVRHTPGHSPGGVSFLVHGAPEPLVIVGDVLFAGSIGRTDLPGGSFDILERSIREQIYTLSDETRVLSGHGPATTIGREKGSNPFVRA